jgi:hypothetical protein
MHTSQSNIPVSSHLPVESDSESIHKHSLPILDIGELSLDLALDELLEQSLKDIQVLLNIVRAYIVWLCHYVDPESLSDLPDYVCLTVLLG